MTAAPSLEPAIDLEKLLALRLVIARLGEMDNAGWWNTRGMLSDKGAFVLRRGFPRAHLFAQARIVFAVAAQRCQTVFNATNVVTLWNLPTAIEDAFEDRWPVFINDVEQWAPRFARVAALRGHDVQAALSDLDLIDDSTANAATRLQRAPEGNAVQLPGSILDQRSLTLLAAGFACAAPGQLAVPFLRVS